MPKNLKEFYYKGSVYIADKSGKAGLAKISSYSWEGSTRAVSSKEAINNLKHQYRKEYHMNTHVPLLMYFCNLKEKTKEGE